MGKKVQPETEGKDSLILKIRKELSPYLHWKEDLEADLKEGSSIIQTSAGRVEYALLGAGGPCVAFMHGAPGGYDQAGVLFIDMLDTEFRMLTWSRPGYLRTPLASGKTFRQQADALAALLDSLDIERVAVFAFSAGGPPAIEFALRYPERVSALIFECAVSRRYVLNPRNIREHLFARLMFNDPALWLSDILAEHSPEIIARSTIEMESTLEEDEVRQRLKDIMHDPGKVKIVMSLIRSMCPTELRRKGIENDLFQLKTLKNMPLERIDAPSLVIHGTDDFDVSMKHALHLKDHIPNAEFFRVEEGFHIMALSDKADEVTSRKIEFLKAHSS